MTCEDWVDIRFPFDMIASFRILNSKLSSMFHLLITKMVGTRGSTPEFSGPAFEAAVQRAVDALLPGLTTRLTNEIRQNGAGGSGDQPPTIQTWLERFGKQKPRSFSAVTTPVDAENWIAHIEKIFEVLGCADEFKARLASYKLEGDALNWWKVFKQAKGGETYVATLSWKDFCDIFFLQYFPRSEQQRYKREYHTIHQRDRETSGEFMKRFLTLVGFVGKKAGPTEEQAKHFKWALCDWILDGIVNTEFTNVAQVSNAARNIEILRDRSSQNNKRNRDGDRIRPTAQGNNQSGYDQKGYDGRSYDRQDGKSNQKALQNRGQQYNRSFGSSGQKGYPDYASSPPCDTCGKLYPGKACHRDTGACFSCGSTGHMARDFLKNGGNSGNGNNKQPATNGRVFALTSDQAAKVSGTILEILSMYDHDVFTGATHSFLSLTFSKHIKVPSTPLDFALSISTPRGNNVVLSHGFRSCPLRFDDKIRFANLLPLEMSDLDIILGMDWLTEHRATIDCYTKHGRSTFCYKGKLSSCFIGPFEILDRVGKVSHRLALPPQLSHVHNVFHASLLRDYNYHLLHVVSYPLDQIREDLSFAEEPEATWETE
ncbi:putative reverse transcriptase domain-containing protein [Tanacetum coccineum]